MQLLLSPGNSAGECLPLNGSTGHVDIRLRQKIVPHAVTIEHLPRSLAFDISSAPKDILIYAFADTPHLTEHLEERLPRALYLGRFLYDIEVRRACPLHSSVLDHHPSHCLLHKCPLPSSIPEHRTFYHQLSYPSELRMVSLPRSCCLFVFADPIA